MISKPLLAALLALALPLSSGSAQEQRGPGPVGVDLFHPANQPDESGKRPAQPEPAHGGGVVVHIANMPQHLNKATENSAVVSWLYDAIHDRLAFQDWEHWHMEPRLASGWETEDTLVLKPDRERDYGAALVRIGSAEKQRSILWGKVAKEVEGYRVRSRSAGSPLPEEGIVVAVEDVASLERGTVFTFHLRDGVKWHDGHPFDAWDVWFSWDLYNNPEVDCDEARAYYTKVLQAEVLDRRTIRFFYEDQYFMAERSICGLPILARHVYDLTDPDNKTFDPDTHAKLEEKHGAGWVPTLRERGEYVNRHPGNNEFIGLGPYRITEYEAASHIRAERWDGYYDAGHPLYGGWVDTITWRYISNDDASMQALLNGEIDYYNRIYTADYFGEATSRKAFTDTLYKGYFYTGAYGYTGWNTLRPELEDTRVRRALAHAFDLEEWRKTKYHGLAKVVTGPQNYFSRGYDSSIEPLPFDLARAEELLVEAGWYDRDGDGVIDKDGIPFEIEFLYPSGNAASRNYGLAFQESLSGLGIRLELRNLEWATLMQRVLARDFDAVQMAWSPSLESDPEQLWHSSKGQPGVRSSNYAAIRDEEVDRLIRAGQRELDVEKRAAIWRDLHVRLYELQPYLFMLNSPRKFAMNKRVHGFQAFQIHPGYDIKRWYIPEAAEGRLSGEAGD